MIRLLHPKGLYNFLFSKERHLCLRLFTILGILPRNLTLYRMAFLHKSNAGQAESNDIIDNNERLEYLGDAILGSIVAEYLYMKYPTASEGFLTQMRSKIVMRKTLNRIADNMGLDVLLNKYNTTRISNSMLGNALEALVGAIYLDRGYRQTRDIVIGRILRSYMDIHELEEKNHNFKSLLLEHCQKNGNEVCYMLKKKYKLNKRDRFQIAVVVDGIEISEADDFNKKSAEQAASHEAIKLMGILSPNGQEEARNAQKNHLPL
ncbi:MAG TPA: ribonuclease III [Saprospiraceae bacterium]|nr:ribonuclease III [Saprospiraceae bacterium]